MSYFLAQPNRPEWLEKAAQDAAHELSPACTGRREYDPDGGDRYHTAACQQRAAVILKHMAAAMALARIDPNLPTIPVTTLAEGARR